MVRCDRCGSEGNITSSAKPQAEIVTTPVSVGPINCNFELCAACRKAVADIAFAAASESKQKEGVPNLPINR